mgnify:FL=1
MLTNYFIKQCLFLQTNYTSAFLLRFIFISVKQILLKLIVNEIFKTSFPMFKN